MALFRKATRKKAKLRMALLGPSGAGKTYSALIIAQGLGNSIAMIDTENGSGDMYAHLCDYDICPITPPFSPDKYVNAIKEADKAGYDVLIIDSLSHAWAGQGGLLEEVDKRKSGQKNQFAAWREITPMHNKLVDTILQSQCHIITTMRTKTAYDFEKDSSGKLSPKKVGLAPVQRDGLEYEFTIVLDIENEKHIASPSKDRTSILDGQYFVPDQEIGQRLKTWLESGEEVKKVDMDTLRNDIQACETMDELSQTYTAWKENIQDAANERDANKVFNARKAELQAVKEADHATNN